MTKKQLDRRVAAVKTANAINAIEGVPVSTYAHTLSLCWAKGELSGEQMKAALLASHKKWRHRRGAMSDLYLYDNVPVLRNELDIKDVKRWI